MSQADFEARHREDWQLLSQWLNKHDKPAAQQRVGAKKNVQSKASEAIAIEFPERYRQLCHHVALARARNYSQALVEELNTIAVRAHHKLYEKVGRVDRHNWVDFVIAAFPLAIWNNRAYVLGAALVFFLPMLCSGLICYFTETGVYSIIGYDQAVEFKAMYSQSSDGEFPKRYAETEVAMFGFYIFNNIGVAFRTFAGGLLFGVGAFFFLAFNGVSIGAVAGYLTQVGLKSSFFSFVAGHSSFELLAIVISGAAGFKLGDALFKPGQLTRVGALRRAALQTVPLMYGVGVMLVIAAGLEAFWSPSAALPVELKYGVGIFLWLVTLAYCCSGYWFAARQEIQEPGA